MLVTQDRESGRLLFGIVTDMAEAFECSRVEYGPLRDALSLDFGLSTSTNEGDLLGRGWLVALKRHDAKITAICRHVQRSGGKPRDSRRYREAVTALRGWVRSEVGRVLNRLVETKKPATLVLEPLGFQHADLCRRLNRILQNCGRSVIEAKLADFKDRFGVEVEEVNPAYTRQTCSCCGYVDKQNRREQMTFRCLWCGNEMHADCNAPRNMGQRRALAIGSVLQRKAAVLGDGVRAFSRRRVGALRSGRTGATGSDADRGRPADPRLTDPYFGGVKQVVARSSGRRKAVQKSSPPRVLAA